MWNGSFICSFSAGACDSQGWLCASHEPGPQVFLVVEETYILELSLLAPISRKLELEGGLVLEPASLIWDQASYVVYF